LTLCRFEVSQPGVVIFLHLLGADSNGHAFRPHSNEYLHNVRVLDAGVRRTEELLEVRVRKPLHQSQSPIPTDTDCGWNLNSSVVFLHLG